ncbi:flagellar hook-basal body complex protein FliE [Arcobacter lacus]|uniref:Flagellar hook-basal body complex protein FliE n=1 Tax=Arcobacter lacus TaxID=1912876 RepID=A0ABX5JKE9_9BACT|nr:flagellar hook-basal body complex protein FliE [Arcobacter lacus]MCT7909852.1 flagellar hook-basal body complex protein FliE [Arcobacter lacus]MCT7911882.1 flagellar hook-basal body complex protein FliE [Arcobacter lacus]PUE66871.1 flagellar hook-basal body complex protein FliE [Arcobacter lacus]
MIGTINSLNSLNPLKINLNAVQETQSNENGELAGKSFQELLDGAVNDVNDTQIKGYDSMKEIATGKVVNLQEAVQKIEEAELTMKLALEVKNKAISAYREVMRMQI